MSNNVLVIKGADFSAHAVDVIIPDNIVIQTGKALQSDGTAYINATEFFNGTKSFDVTNSEFDIEFEIPSTADAARSIYGIAVNSPQKNMLHLVNLGSSSDLRIDDGSYPTNPSYIQSVIGKKVVYSRIGTSISASVGDTTGTYSSGVYPNRVCSGDFYLFALCSVPDGSAANNKASGVKIYSASLKMNGVLVFDIVACTYNGTPAMFDYVSNKVLTAANGGTFTLTD